MYFQVRLKETKHQREEGEAEQAAATEETIEHQREEGEAEQAAQDAAIEETIEHQREETKAEQVAQCAEFEDKGTGIAEGNTTNIYP